MGSFSFAIDMLAKAYRWPGRVAVGLIAVVALLLAAGCGGGGSELILATTTSTQDSGLLDVLVPSFEDGNDYNVKVIAVGSGQAIEMGERGDADVLLVHAPSAEEEFVDAGHGTNRQLVMHNDFIIVGPADDPAGVADAADATAAMQAIAAAAAPFVSRGDDSGTHTRELSVWEAAGIDPVGESWYDESGQGMGATLQIAGQTAAYTISDRATYLSQQDNLDLELLFEDDPKLLNIYHVMQVNPDEFDDLNSEGAEAFVAFMIGDDAQQMIGEFGVEEFGEPLFVPDAGKSEDDLTGR
ncbi:MAG: substrate-binding domain-containing protein [Dehalococcoidia bacterium]